jgi:tRNA(Ile)-lysidine synthase
LLVRTWRAGDRIEPSGMQGRKKLQDLFSDMKMPQALRHRVPIVVAPEGIVWVAGYRAARPFLATSTTRERVLLEVRDAPAMRED